MIVRDHLFLILFDRVANAADVTDLGHDVDAAMARFRACEHEFLDREDVEVALLGSASLETLKRTHSSYFGPSAGLGAALSAIR